MHYKDLTIRNFRGIKDLTLPELGRVNLLAGKNNTGKSSALEALMLHAQNGSPNAIHEILTFREEFDDHIETADVPRLERSFEILNLFRGFPTLLDSFKPIHVSENVKEDVMTLSIEVEEEYPVLRVGTENRVVDYPYDTLIRSRSGNIVIRPVIKERMSCQIVNSGSSQKTNNLGQLWDKVALTKHEKDVIEALRIFDPNIEDFSMIGRDRPMVRAKGIDHPVPLSSFGDGMNRMLRVMLSLVNARGGVLLVDEFENGLHYSAQVDAWRMVFKLARDLDVQVFATTHSWDAISAFQKAACEFEDAGVLIRLNRRWGEVIPTVYSVEELAIADRYSTEVR